MRKLSIAVTGVAIACSSAAQAVTVVVYVNPMTLEKHTRVFDTPGPDRFLMCSESTGTAGCTELPIKKRR